MSTVSSEHEKGTIPPLDKDDPRRESLAKDLEYWSESFWKNEESGERRVNFYITLVTAVMAGLAGLYQYAAKEGPADDVAEVVLRVAIPALSGLLLVGIITFLRMVQRNVVTDGYKERADAVRMLLLGSDTFRRIYRSIELPGSRVERMARSLSNGGLSVMMMGLNSMVAGVLAGLSVAPRWAPTAWECGAQWFGAVFVTQFAFSVWVTERSRARELARRKALVS